MTADRPRIYLYQEHLNTLFQEFRQTRREVTVPALGMVLDDAEIFHVYISEPQAHFAGRPCRAAVRLHADTAARAPDAGASAGDGPLVLVDVRLDADTLATTAYVTDAAGMTTEGAVHFVPYRSELYSRSQGLLETDALRRRSVLVVGLGSGGSAVAVALAQAGLGRMVLADRDRIEIGNVARHACGVGDLGRRKTRAVADLLVGKNPDLHVTTLDVDVLAEPDLVAERIKEVDLVIAATDSDQSRFVLNDLAVSLQATTIFGRVLTRASGGEVLRVRPGAGPCLACVYTEQFVAQRPREYSRIGEAREDAPAYVGEDELAAKIQVGLASDIAPVSNLMVKLALVELSRGTGGGLEVLDRDLRADFYVWANRREGVYAGWPTMGYQYDQPAILRWYGAKLDRRADCAVCGARPGGPATDDPAFFGGGR